MQLDFRARVLIAAALPGILIAVLLVWYFTQTRISDLERELQERGYAMVRSLAPASEYGVFSGNKGILQQLVNSAAGEAGVEAVAVLDGSGHLLAMAGETLPETVLSRPLPDKAELVQNGSSSFLFRAPVGQLQTVPGDAFDLDFERRPVKPVRLGAVLVQLSDRPLQQRKYQLMRNAALIALIGLLAAGLLEERLSRNVTRPVQRLAEVVSEIERGNLGARAPVETSGALKLLERGINKMAASLADARSGLEQRIAEATAELKNQKERAEQANRAKTQFLAAASHDLRQPLQAIGLFVSVLRMRAKDKEILEPVERIERGLAALEQILEALLDISKLDAGVVTPNIESFPVAGVFERLHDLFADDAARRKLRLVFHDTSAWCRADRLLLERILSNLISNALRYTSRGGVLVGCRYSGDQLRIEVWDTGAGIPDDKREEIFREFVQLSNPGRARDKGMGLGLATVERLGRLLGHPIALRSRVGRGSVFAVSVPRSAPGERVSEAMPQTSADSDRLAGARVLVIDDDEQLLGAMKEFLCTRHAVPMLAAGYEEARRMLRGQPAPELIVSDFRLGQDKDGIAVISALRGEFGRDIPAVIITGDAAPEVLLAVSQSGLPLASKPILPDMLAALLNRLLAKPAAD